jgi:hypothetical protein
MRGEDAVVVLSAADYARLATVAAQPTLAALFAAGPFARLDDFDESVPRERAPFREPLDF